MSPDGAPTPVFFYHLERSGVEDALPELLEKTLERGKRALVTSADLALLERLDERLWTWRPESFLAHGRAGTPDAARQPILLAEEASNDNGAQFLFALGEPPTDLSRYERCVILFSSADETAVARSRVLWKTYKAEGAALSYHQQTEEGRWVRRA